MDKQRVLTFDNDGGPVVITGAAATVAQGVRRTRLRMMGREAAEADEDRALLRVYVYPDLTAATLSIEGLPWPLTFEQFLDLPDAWVSEWEQAVYALNPHWLPDGGPSADPKA